MINAYPDSYVVLLARHVLNESHLECISRIKCCTQEARKAERKARKAKKAAEQKAEAKRKEERMREREEAVEEALYNARQEEQAWKRARKEETAARSCLSMSFKLFEMKWQIVCNGMATVV